MDGGAQPQRGERGESATGSYRPPEGRLWQAPNQRFSPVQLKSAHPPIVLATNHVVGFSRLKWLSHDGMIRRGIMAYGAQTPYAPPRPPAQPG